MSCRHVSSHTEWKEGTTSFNSRCGLGISQAPSCSYAWPIPWPSSFCHAPHNLPNLRIARHSAVGGFPATPGTGMWTTSEGWRTYRSCCILWWTDIYLSFLLTVQRASEWELANPISSWITKAGIGLSVRLARIHRPKIAAKSHDQLGLSFCSDFDILPDPVGRITIPIDFISIKWSSMYLHVFISMPA